ncbi:MAG: hypothetical protein RDV48_31295 [Candidatus Eremiobacteraeota bacterium]|nr:hypothetical protein [Candidatus Eremiobacteraeota bacterium]
MKVSEATPSLDEFLRRIITLEEGMTRSPVPHHLVEKVSHSCDFRAIPRLVPTALSRNRHVAAAAAAIIASLLESAPPSAYHWLDETVRRIDIDWKHHVKPALLWGPSRVFRTAHDLGEMGWVIAALGTFDRSGYIREAALKELACMWGGRQLPFLILRLNDWVPEIRELAAGILEKRLDGDYAVHWVACLPLVLSLRECRRDNHSSFVEGVISLVTGPEHVRLLLEALSSASRETRRFAYHVALQHLPDSMVTLIGRALREKDVIIKKSAALIARHHASEEPFRRLLGTMVRDRSALVRREALLAFRETGDPGLQGHAEKALFDNDSAMRRIAREIVSGMGGEPDIAGFYREALGTVVTPRLTVALLGLGETGKESDATIALPYARGNQAPVRKAALTALGSLAPSAHFELFLGALSDENPGVSAAARKILARLPGRLEGDLLCGMFTRSEAPHVKWNILLLFRAMPKWESLPSLLLIYARSEGELEKKSLALLKRWLTRFNRNQAKPLPSQAEKGRLALKEAQRKLEKPLARELEFLLSGWEAR